MCGDGILEENGNLEKWNSCGCEGRKGKQGKGKKGKELINEDIFLVLENENIGNTDSQVQVKNAGKHFGKYRNRPKFKYLGTTRKFYQKSIIIYED